MKAFCLPSVSLNYLISISPTVITLRLCFLGTYFYDSYATSRVFLDGHGSLGTHKERKKLFLVGSIFRLQLQRAMERNGFFQMKRVERLHFVKERYYNRYFRSLSYRSTSMMRPLGRSFRSRINGNVRLAMRDRF